MSQCLPLPAAGVQSPLTSASLGDSGDLEKDLRTGTSGHTLPPGVSAGQCHCSGHYTACHAAHTVTSHCHADCKCKHLNEINILKVLSFVFLTLSSAHCHVKSKALEEFGGLKNGFRLFWFRVDTHSLRDPKLG